MSFKPIAGVLSAGLLCFSVNANADIKVQECNDCHGNDGVSTEPTIPSIAGIPEISLQDQLFGYLDGRHAKTVSYVNGDTSRPATDMATVVADMSDERIEELAAHYSALPFVPAKQEFDAKLATFGQQIHEKNCEKCHSEGGSLQEDEASILAGQWRPYLIEAMNDYIEGRRDGESSMVKRLEALKPEHLTALSYYYASQQ